MFLPIRQLEGYPKAGEHRMRPISPALQARFIAYLKKRTIPSSTHFFCVKWLRYCLDFYEKYHFPRAQGGILGHCRVDMSLQLRDALKDVRHERRLEAVKKGWGGIPEWVFVSETGTPLDSSHWRSRVFSRHWNRLGCAAQGQGARSSAQLCQPTHPGRRIPGLCA
jgi:hypothetical protein